MCGTVLNLESVSEVTFHCCVHGDVLPVTWISLSPLFESSSVFFVRIASDLRE